MRNRALFLIAASVASAAAAVVAAQAPRPGSVPAGAAPRPSSQTQARPASVPMMPGVHTVLFKGMHYRLVGPSRGGRVTTVTGVPSQPRTFYMGVASGGLFKTTDGGANWFPVTDGQVPLGSTGAVAVADSDPNVVYLGTGSDDV